MYILEQTTNTKNDISKIILKHSDIIEILLLLLLYIGDTTIKIIIIDDNHAENIIGEIIETQNFNVFLRSLEQINPSLHEISILLFSEYTQCLFLL
jgi:hypothetical protein